MDFDMCMVPFFGLTSNLIPFSLPRFRHVRVCGREWAGHCRGRGGSGRDQRRSTALPVWTVRLGCHRGHDGWDALQSGERRYSAGKLGAGFGYGGEEECLLCSVSLNFQRQCIEAKWKCWRKRERERERGRERECEREREQKLEEKWSRVSSITKPAFRDVLAGAVNSSTSTAGGSCNALDFASVRFSASNPWRDDDALSESTIYHHSIENYLAM